MMAKHQISHNARNLIAYCLRVGKHQNKLVQTRPRILLANLCPAQKNVKALTAAIQGANEMRKTDRVHHLIFAHPKSDIKRVSEVGERKLIQEAIEGLKEKGINLDDAPYVVIAHQDKDNHIDYHLIAASTDLKGKAIKDGYIGSRAMKITNDISKKYGLALNNDKAKGKRKQNAEEVSLATEPKISDLSSRIELFDVETVEVNVKVSAFTSKGLDKNAETELDKIEKLRAKEREEKQLREEKMRDFNEKCNKIGLTKDERKEVWVGHEISFQVGREVNGMVNDKEAIIMGEDRGDKINLVAVVEGVVMGVIEWLRDIADRLRQREQQRHDKARQQSQQEAQARRRGGGIKR